MPEKVDWIFPEDIDSTLYTVVCQFKLVEVEVDLG